MVCRGYFRICVTFVVISLLLAWTTGATASGFIRQGDRGDEVSDLQEYLILLGFLSGRVDGVFGPATHSAIVRFQASSGLAPDGVVGPATWDALLAQSPRRTGRVYRVAQGDTLWTIAGRFGTSVEILAAANGLSRPDVIKPGMELVIPESQTSRRFANDVELVHWNEARNVFTHQAVIIDVQTGLSFRVQRRGGYNHADAEPLTTQDTAILKRIYGGEWSYARRAVVVVVGRRAMAASINGMPHGGQEIHGNGFNGHFCVHFLGSRTHGSNRLDPDHQRMVHIAAGY